MVRSEADVASEAYRGYATWDMARRHQLFDLLPEPKQAPIEAKARRTGRVEEGRSICLDEGGSQSARLAGRQTQARQEKLAVLRVP